MWDVVIVGSGPNGLSAGIKLAQEGQKVLILEKSEQVGGGMRTKELTLPGFHHDFCSAVHPMGVLSPFFRTLPLHEHGLVWVHPPASVAHPLDGEEAVILTESLEETMENLRDDGQNWKNLVAPYLKKPHAFLSDAMAPLQIPQNPLLLARFGLKGLRSAKSLANSHFSDHRAKALFAGLAAHSILPLDKTLSGAVGLIFAITAHMCNWPIAAQGSFRIAQALCSYFHSLGGTIECNRFISSMDQLPEAKVYLFDTDPLQVAGIAGDVLSDGYKKRLKRYRFGPGCFKLDFALDGPIPWKDERCLLASTVHVGGTLDEIAKSEKDVWNGTHNEKPFVLVCQQSQFDLNRSPENKHTGYAYCHVPYGSSKDLTEQIENQVERFAPGFKKRILAKHKTFCADFTKYNPNFVGGAITGGSADLFQLFTRPVTKWDPYRTSNPKVFICSASSPPGGGVHGMCGYYAAKSALKVL